jgi:HlyD family secretion protein
LKEAAMRRAVVVVAVVLLVGAGMVWWRVVRTISANSSTIRGSGMVEVTQVDVAFEVGGRILERPVDEGQLIDKGEPVARLDERDYRLQVERATAAKTAAEARYHLALKGARAQEIDQALAALEAADSDLSLKRAEHRRMNALHRSGVISDAELDRSATALAAAEAGRDQARLQLDLLKEGSRTEEIEEARARLREAEKALELAELQLARCQLYAPVAGRVLTKSREVGEIAQPGMPVVTIGDLTRPWLNIYVGERDLGKVALGMQAEVMVDSFPQQPFAGRITFISEKSEFTPKNIQTPDERVKLVYRVKIELENRDQQLKPGMPADAVIRLNGASPLR